MQVGAVFPQTAIGADVGALRAYAQAVEELGYAHLLAYDHVVGADPEVHAPWQWPYDVHTTFHEPLVMFGYLAAVSSLELVTGVLILPQRQTVLVAKQAAELDILSEGRLRLGVALGWNAVEYQALGKDFSTRGRRIDDQIALLRTLWTQSSVTFERGDEHVVGAGINPPPVQRPIPIWLGGVSPAAYRRIGRLADGWFPRVAVGPELDEASAVITVAAREAGRDPAAIRMESQLDWTGDPDEMASRAAEWQRAGASHTAVNTIRAGLATVDDHIRALAAAADTLSLRA
ncbi:MAG TPA: LLM class F420-dependent oxidoreductase [Pseudonocardia sp.]|nr:LLM class F420-dependent oxidoreductase [Pseudonocardia sp.]